MPTLSNELRARRPAPMSAILRVMRPSAHRPGAADYKQLHIFFMPLARDLFDVLRSPNSVKIVGTTIIERASGVR
jgi:hypothetical protein